MYKVIQRFRDLQDKGNIYNVGEDYPRKGYSPSDKRVKELSTDENGLNKPLIKEIQKKKEAFKLEHVGGGFYELSNGEKIKGKKAAQKAQEALSAGDK